MRFSVGLPTDHVDAADEFVSADAIAEMAAAAESAGFDAGFVTDHPAPDGKWLAAGGHHALDPFVALSFAAAATTRLMLHTHILVLGYRNPMLAAKSVHSLQLLSGDRMILGVGTGYLRPEFAALGADFDARNDRLDAAIDAVRDVLSADTYRGSGPGWSARGVELRPRVKVPPIWVGGNSHAAARRAVDRGDAWVPFPNPASVGRAARTPPLSTIEEFETRVHALRAYEQVVGRETPVEICFMPFSLGDRRTYDPDAVRAEVARLASLGVTWLTVGAAADTRAEWLEGILRLAADLDVAAA